MTADHTAHVTLAVAVLALAGCRSTASGGNVVTVTAHDYTFDAPAEIPAGLTTFHLVNSGPSLHHLQLIKLEGGKSGDDFVAALKAGGPPPQWATLAGGPNPPEPGSMASATLVMEPGSYAIVCFVPAVDGTPHVMKGMVQPLKVTGASPATVVEPAADVVMKLVDFDFQLSAPIKAGRHTIRVENAGAQPHEVAFVRLKPGKTGADFTAWGEKPEGPAPGEVHGGISGIMPGTHAFANLDLPAGDYALICFFPDIKDGKAHFEHGMMKVIQVT